MKTSGFGVSDVLLSVMKPIIVTQGSVSLRLSVCSGIKRSTDIYSLRLLTLFSKGANSSGVDSVSQVDASLMSKQTAPC